jgi:ribonuclease VapC
MQKSGELYVLDSYALIVYFKHNEGWQEVEQLLSDASRGGIQLLMSIINWGEVYYTRIVDVSKEQADWTEQIIKRFPITIIPPDIEMTRQAAIFKAMGGISYADCFAAALAVREHATLVTGEPEFKKLEKLGHIKIKWI